VVTVLEDHWVELCHQQPACELHESPHEFPKAPMGAVVLFSCLIYAHSVGINLTQHYLVALIRECRGSLGNSLCRGSSSAELSFSPAREHGLMGRENQRRKGMKGNNQSCGHHSLVATKSFLVTFWVACQGGP